MLQTNENECQTDDCVLIFLLGMGIMKCVGKNRRVRVVWFCGNGAK